LVCIATVLAIGVRPSRGDIVVRVEVKDMGEKAEAAPVLTVETLAGAGGHFSAKTTVAKQTVVLKGDLKKQDNGKHRVHVSFSAKGDEGMQQITTLIEVPLNKPQHISGLQGAGTQRSIVLTLEDDAAK
jgi:hypothetical protein